MIPKIVHYCWFGKKEKPTEVINFINNWKVILKDYEFIEWNEDNFPVNYNDYVSEAYTEKKYAFVSDVARLYALKQYGGIYFDTDIEVKKSLDPFLNYRALMAFESNNIVMTAFFAVEKKSKFIDECLDSYNETNFIKADGSLDLTPNTVRFTKILKNYGMVPSGQYQELSENMYIFPREIFGAFDTDNSCFVDNENTVLIHHCNGSWTSNSYKLIDKIKRRLVRILGYKIYKKLKNIFHIFK